MKCDSTDFIMSSIASRDWTSKSNTVKIGNKLMKVKEYNYAENSPSDTEMNFIRKNVGL